MEGNIDQVMKRTQFSQLSLKSARVVVLCRELYRIDATLPNRPHASSGCAASWSVPQDFENEVYHTFVTRPETVMLGSSSVLGQTTRRCRLCPHQISRHAQNVAGENGEEEDGRPRSHLHLIRCSRWPRFSLEEPHPPHSGTVDLHFALARSFPKQP
jgi:hypothetical protein